jgi:hypothetical protein
MHRIRTLAAGAIVAVAIGACQGGTQGQTGAPSLPPVPSNLASLVPSGLASAAPSALAEGLFPVFQAQGGSNLTGGGIVTNVEDGASVVLGVVAPGAAESMPAVVIEGDCASQTGSGPTPPPDLFPSAEPSGAAASPAAESPAAASAAASPAASEAPSASPSTEFPLWLTPIAFGTSNSVIGVSTEDLTASPHAIVIEMSPTDTTIIACADLAEGPPTAAPTPSDDGGASGSPAASAATSPEASGAP